MAKISDDPITAAIIETEKEIAGDAWNVEETTLDETGDRSIEAMGEGLEGEHEPDEEEAETEGEDETPEEEAEAETAEGEEKPKQQTAVEKTGDGEKSSADKPEGRVPPGRLREAGERARAAETERDQLKERLAATESNSRKELDALNAKLDGVLAAIRTGKSETAAKIDETQTVPDLLENPEAYAEYLQKGFRDELGKRDRAIENMRVENSMAVAHARHGETFAKAYDAVTKLDPANPEQLETGRRLINSPNPGEAIVAWFKRNETLREVGDDPGKYRERLVTETRESLMKDPEFRKALLDEMRAEAGNANNGNPNTITRLPRSLNGAGGGNSGRMADTFGLDASDQAIADSAWSG